VVVDDLLDRPVFDHHLLVVAVALCGHSGLNSIAHQNIYFYLFSFFG
jgi:hypothetical protein